MHKTSVRAGVLLYLAEMTRRYQGLAFGVRFDQLNWPGYPKRNVDLMVRKMVEGGEVRLVRGVLRITSVGEHLLKVVHPARLYRDRNWDGQWRLVTFVIPEQRRVKRNQLRTYLALTGFGRWQQSVYVTTHPMLDLVREYAKHLGIERYMEDWTMEVMGQGSVQQFGERVFEMEARTLAWKELVLQARGVKGRGEMREIMRIWQQLLLSDPYLPVELGLNKSDKFKQELLSEMEGWVTNAKNWG